jgi:hypothetical protein
MLSGATPTPASDSEGGGSGGYVLMYVLPTITREKSIRSQNQVLLDDRLEIAETPNLVKRPVCLQHMRLPIPNPGCGVQIQTVSFCASQSVIIDAINFIDKLRMTLNSLYLVN